MDGGDEFRLTGVGGLKTTVLHAREGHSKHLEFYQAGGQTGVFVVVCGFYPWIAVMNCASRAASPPAAEIRITGRRRMKRTYL